MSEFNPDSWHNKAKTPTTPFELPCTKRISDLESDMTTMRAVVEHFGRRCASATQQNAHKTHTRKEWLSGKCGGLTVCREL